MIIAVCVYLVTCALYFVAIISSAHVFKNTYNTLARKLVDEKATDNERVSAYTLSVIIAIIPIMRLSVLTDIWDK